MKRKQLPGGNPIPQDKLSFEHFLEAVDGVYQVFALELHHHLTENGCKATVKDKKSGPFVSYKHIKTKKSIVNLLLGKKGVLVRIYGKNAGNYLDFLNTLPEEMVLSINGATDCKRLVHNTCSPKCSGYDVTIREEHFQKCRYSGFEFLVTSESSLYIKAFAQNEIKGRTAA